MQLLTGTERSVFFRSIPRFNKTDENIMTLRRESDEHCENCDNHQSRPLDNHRAHFGVDLIQYNCWCCGYHQLHSEVNILLLIQLLCAKSLTLFLPSYCSHVMNINASNIRNSNLFRNKTMFYGLDKFNELQNSGQKHLYNTFFLFIIYLGCMVDVMCMSSTRLSK